MPLTSYGKNEAAKGASAKMTWLGLTESAAYTPTSNTAIGSSVLNLTGAKSKGFTNGATVVVRKLTASITGLLVEKRLLYVVGEATNTFELAYEEGGAGIKVAGHELETASTEFALLIEISGGSYKRIKTTWGTAAGGEISDTAAEAFKVPAGKEITDAIWWEGESTGKAFANAKLEAAEKFGSEGEYKVTSDKLEANAVA